MNKNNEGEVERELLEHSIKIDDYTEIKIRIPKVLDVIEFTSIVEKSRKLLKLGEISFMTPVKKHNNFVSDDNNSQLLTDYENSGFGGKERVAKKYGFSSVSSLQSKIYYLRHNVSSVNKVTVGKRGTRTKYDDVFVNRCKHMVSSGMKTTEVAKQMNIPVKYLYKLLQRTRSQTKTKGSSKKGIWTEQLESKFRELLKKGFTSRAIADELNVDRKRVYDKVYYYKTHGGI